MAIIVKPNTFTNGDTLDAAKFNEDYDTLYNEINGGIDSTNIDTNGVATDNIADNAVTPAKIDDTTTDVYTVVNLTVTGSLLTSKTLQKIASASPSDVNTYTFSGLTGDTDLQYLIILHALRSGTGNFNYKMQFNGDTSNKYRGQYLRIADDGTVLGQADIVDSDNIPIAISTAALEVTASEVKIMAGASKNKQAFFVGGNGDMGDTVIGNYISGHGKWYSSSQITSITIYGAPASGYAFVAGSTIELWAIR